MVPVIHAAHSGDGFPLCWSLDQDGPFEATRDDDAVTCPDCLEQVRETQEYVAASVRGDTGEASGVGLLLLAVTLVLGLIALALTAHPTAVQ